MLRHFTDENGIKWKVWDVWPMGRGSAGTTRSESSISVFAGQGFSDGWLCFECDEEKRRLAPIPPEWETCAECDLEQMCTRAGYITRTPRDSSTVRESRDNAD